MKRKVVRPQVLAENICIIDGFSLSGKALIGPVVSSFDRCELWIVHLLYEQLCWMDTLGKIERDAASAMVRMHVDHDLYNLMIGRYVNFRDTDASGVHRNLMSDRYRKRLTSKEGDCVKELIKERSPILILMTHNIFGASELLFDSFKERLKLFVVTVRHPLFLIERWFSRQWHKRFGYDRREFTICCEVDRNVAPLIAHGWEKEYNDLSPLEQAIRLVFSVTESNKKRLEALEEGDMQKVLFVPFESIVIRPFDYLNVTMEKLGTKGTQLTGDVMKQEGLPRQMESDYLEILRVGFDELMQKEEVSQESRGLVKWLCEDYEKTYIK